MNAPALSIITPVYQGRRFIEFCMKNVIWQSCPAVEHIIVDGDSTDGTVEIVRKYAERFPHIRGLCEKDDGHSDALNKGIAMARGSIIGVLMVDDFYEPNVLNRVLERFKTLPEPTFLVGNCNMRDDDDNITSVNRPGKLNIVDLILRRRCTFPVNPSAYFYHASLHKTIGLYRGLPNVPGDESNDREFVFNAVRTANVVHVDQVWGNFRTIEGTKTQQLISQGVLKGQLEGFRRWYFRKLPLSLRLRIGVRKLKLALNDIGLGRVRYVRKTVGFIARVVPGWGT